MKVRVYRKTSVLSEVREETIDSSLETEEYFGDRCFILRPGTFSPGRKRKAIWGKEGRGIYFSCPWCKGINQMPQEMNREINNLRCLGRREVLSVWCAECHRHMFIRLAGY